MSPEIETVVIQAIVSAITALLATWLGAKFAFRFAIRLQKGKDDSERLGRIKKAYLSYMAKLQELLYYVRRIIQLQELAAHHSDNKTVIKTANELESKMGGKAYRTSLEGHTTAARDFKIEVRDEILNLFSHLGELESKRMQATLEDDSLERRNNFRKITEEDFGYNEKTIEEGVRILESTLRQVNELIQNELQAN